MHEFEIIARAAKFPRFHPELSPGLDDDAACLQVGSQTLIWAVDSLVENTHFLRSMPANEIGWKALAVNLSDLAAMHACPLAALLSLGLPPALPEEWIQGFFAGLEHACRTYRVDLAGGDTVRQSSEIHISLSILGQSSRPVTRQGAQAGDLLVATGAFGGAAAGLYCYQQGLPFPDLLARHWHPLPRLEASQHLAQHCKRLAMLDTSDGLARSLQLLCELNGLGCQLDFSQIPVQAGLSAHFSAEQIQHWVLHGGEDFELLAAVPPEAWPQLQAQGGFSLLGVLTAEPTIQIQQGSETWLLNQTQCGFQHF